MILGTGTMEVNEATIIEAVQEYLDGKLNSDAQVKVTGVEALTNIYPARSFKVSFQERGLKPNPLSSAAP